MSPKASNYGPARVEKELGFAKEERRNVNTGNTAKATKEDPISDANLIVQRRGDQLKFPEFPNLNLSLYLGTRSH